MMDSCLVLNQALLNYTHEAKELLKDFHTQKLDHHRSESTDDEEPEQPRETPEELLEKLKKVLSTIEATGTHLLEFTTRAQTSYAKLESDVNTAAVELADAKSQISHLSGTSNSDWGNSAPSKISLRRTNETRLQCIRSLQKELAMQRRKNATLERALEQAYGRLEANSCTHELEVSHLKAAVAHEIARNQRQGRELDRLKRSERLSKRNGVRKSTAGGHHGSAICDLSKQLEGLVLQAAARQRRGAKTEPTETPEPNKTITIDDNENVSDFDMMMRIAVELHEQTNGQLPEISLLDNSFILDNILEDNLPMKPEPA
uniref:CENP-H domain-containing protein n=1 Tax=Panagrellus redivivus TaxID=6233 RepID=A0A7E4VRL8_PANRE